MLIASTPLAVLGDLTVVETKQDDGQLTTYKLTVTPAAEPVPALRHRLMHREIRLKQGNAAPYYYRAFAGVAAAAKAADEEFGYDYHQWHWAANMRLSDLPLDKVREAVHFWQGSVMTNLRIATDRRTCDWEWYTTEIRGTDLVGFLLDEMQDSRSLSRAIQLQTRLAMAEGRTAEAIDLVRMNYRLGRDLAREPLLICDLVGIAIAEIGNGAVIELIAQPNSPNLYWALTELPRPLIAMRDSLRTEMSMGLRIFPFLVDAEMVDRPPEEWSRLLAKAIADSQLLKGDLTPNTVVRTGLTALSLVVYPDAKQRLIEGGMGRERVEKMPVGQVLAIDGLREYRRIADELEKWQYIPYRVARERKGPDPFGGGTALWARGYGHTLASLLLPALQAARTAEQRLTWKINGIRTVEAIRMHAAETGRLPAALDAIHVVPVPENPATGQPYVYRLDGDTAVLDMPHSDGFSVAFRFQISLRDDSAGQP